MTMHPEGEPVLACSLNTAGAAARAGRWRRLLTGHLRETRPTAHGRRLTFAPDVRAELDDLVAAERVCCPFLTLTLAPEDGAIALDVVAPDAAGPIVEMMFGPG
jgi:hypothetical protein